MNEAVAIFITTPDDPDSMFMRMVTRVDEAGNPRMPVIWLGQPCERCKQQKRDVCPHVWYEAPAHKAPWRYERLKWIYDQHKDIDARENHARASVRNAPSFPQHLVDSFFAQPRRPLAQNPGCVFLSIDPACGGQNDFAMAAGYYDGQGFTVRSVFNVQYRLHRRHRHRRCLHPCVVQVDRQPMDHQIRQSDWQVCVHRCLGIGPLRFLRLSMPF